MKQTLAILLSALMVCSALAGALAIWASAEETALPTPTFTYDFSTGLSDEIADPKGSIDISYENADGYVTFRAEGSDPYFRFNDGCEPTPPTQNLAYAVIKYRTTAAIASGEFFTNRRSGPQWGAAGTHVTWSYKNDGNWHAVVVDNTAAWGSAVDDYLYAFRLDPPASGATAGDTIDIAYIHFFADKASAMAYAEAEFPEDFAETEPPPAPTHEIQFMVDGVLIYTVTYSEGDTSFVPPVVPLRPGYTGEWEAFTLGTTDLVVNAVYTATSTETVPPMPDTEPETEPAATEPDTPAPTDPATEAPADTGCASAMAASALVAMLPVACILSRRSRKGDDR